MHRSAIGSIALHLLPLCLTAPANDDVVLEDDSTHAPKSAGTAVKYSTYGTAIPIVIGGALVLAGHPGDGSDENMIVIGLA